MNNVHCDDPGRVPAVIPASEPIPRASSDRTGRGTLRVEGTERSHRVNPLWLVAVSDSTARRRWGRSGLEHSHEQQPDSRLRSRTRRRVRRDGPRTASGGRYGERDNEPVDLLTAIGNTYLEASEAPELRTRREERQTIALPIPENTLGLFEIAPSDESVWAAGFQATSAVYDYFDIDANPVSALSEIVRLRAP